MRSTIALAAVLTLSACTPHRAALPLDTPDDAAPADANLSASPPPVRAPTDPSLIEEDLPAPVPPSDDTGEAEPADEPGLSLDAPAPLDTITPQTPPNVAAATRLADAARQRMVKGDYGGALEQLERAIAVDPSNAYAYYFLAELHLIHHTYDQAIAFAERSASLSTRRAPQWASRAYVLQGNAYEAIGRFADARAAYQRALGLAANNLAAQVGFARVGGMIATP